MKMTIYGAEWCAQCKNAKAMLEAKGVSIEYLDVDDEAVGERFSSFGLTSLPQIFSGDEYIGGLRAALRFIQNAQN